MIVMMTAMMTEMMMGERGSRRRRRRMTKVMTMVVQVVRSVEYVAIDRGQATKELNTLTYYKGGLVRQVLRL